MTVAPLPTVRAVSQAEIEAPRVIPLKATLLQTWPAQDGIELMDGTALFDSAHCLKFQGEALFCAPNAKTFTNGLNWNDGVRFAAYGGVTCKPVGMNRDRLKVQVEEAFNLGESTAVERGLMKHRFVANAAGGTPGVWAAPTDITPAGGAVSIPAGIAALEGHAGDNYVGAPTLHVPRSIASRVVGVDGAQFEGNVLQTKLGSLMVAGAGYDFPNTGPTGAAAADGEKWIYVTGGVVIRRGEVSIIDTMDTTNNDVFVLAERPYVVAVDCYAAAIRVLTT